MTELYIATYSLYFDQLWVFTPKSLSIEEINSDEFW